MKWFDNYPQYLFLLEITELHKLNVLYLSKAMLRMLGGFNTMSGKDKTTSSRDLFVTWNSDVDFESCRMFCGDTYMCSNRVICSSTWDDVLREWSGPQRSGVWAQTCPGVHNTSCKHIHVCITTVCVCVCVRSPASLHWLVYYCSRWMRMRTAAFGAAVFRHHWSHKCDYFFSLH